jgi:hypothetical protein
LNILLKIRPRARSLSEHFARLEATPVSCYGPGGSAPSRREQP